MAHDYRNKKGGHISTEIDSGDGTTMYWGMKAKRLAKQRCHHQQRRQAYKIVTKALEELEENKHHNDAMMDGFDYGYMDDYDAFVEYEDYHDNGIIDNYLEPIDYDCYDFEYADDYR